tara:strand:+ start:369 stop:515 length:147 start_codon:yes stop_codon:yes gene_type:complete
MVIFDLVSGIRKTVERASFRAKQYSILILFKKFQQLVPDFELLKLKRG